MDHAKWEAYLSLCRKVESGGRNSDVTDPVNLALQREFVEHFRRFLAPPARVMAPGAVAEALLLAETGYETHALVLGPDNVTWLQERRQQLPRPELLHVRELDAHDLDYSAGFFDGYFSIQFYEHLLSWFAHLGEVRHCSRDGAVAFVDACGTTNDACKMVWHTNLVPERCVLDQWEFWGFKELWRGPHGDNRPQFVFEMLPLRHPDFKYSGYLEWVMRLRAGERVNYDYNCNRCTREIR